LALAQTELVRGCLAAAYPELKVVVEILRTRGDDRLDLSLQSTGALDKGLFTKELEVALVEGRVDAAVHSLKDLPVEQPEGLVLGAILPREDVADVLVARVDAPLNCLATSSPRRARQWLEKYPEHRTVEIRGNVPTRLRKVRESNEFEAAILALAGLKRLGLAQENGCLLECEETAGLVATVLPWMLAAPGQGAVAVQMRAGDAATVEKFRVLHCAKTEAAVTAERGLLALLGGGCHQALGAHALIRPSAQPDAADLELRAVYFPSENGAAQRAEVQGSILEPMALAAAAKAQFSL
jgi:hydroxymethylbilane synthase